MKEQLIEELSMITKDLGGKELSEKQRMYLSYSPEDTLLTLKEVLGKVLTNKILREAEITSHAGIE